MTSDLDDLVRATLTDRAPSTVRPADWATLRARAARRTAAGRATVVVGAAAVGTLTVTTLWAPAPAEVAPGISVPERTTDPTVPASPDYVLRGEIVNRALTYERTDRPDWSTGPAMNETIHRALIELMTVPQITDPTAQPQVIWSSAGHIEDTNQGPKVVVAVAQPSGWVIGFWDERAPFGPWIRSMSFGTMPGGPLDDRLVGFVIPEEDYSNISGGRHVVFVPPTAATRVVVVRSQADADADPNVTVGAEEDLGSGFGEWSFPNPVTIRAYTADGTLLDEQTYDE